MPAVSSFSLYAAVAVFADFILQVTCFVSLMSLDAKRAIDNRVDCFPCISLPVTLVAYKSSLLQRYMKNTHSRLLAKLSVRKTVLGIFLATLSISFVGMFYMERGLDQKIALPTDSYLIPYFDDLANYLMVGPPLFFVVRDLNATSQEGQYVLSSKNWIDANLFSMVIMIFLVYE